MPHRRRACCNACHSSAGACLSRRRWWLWRWHARRRLWRRDACHGRRRDALRRDGRRRTLRRDGRRPAFQRSPVLRRTLCGARSVRAAFLARCLPARLPPRLPLRFRPSWLLPSPLLLPPALPSLCILWRALLLRRLWRLLRRLLAQGVDGLRSAVGQRLWRLRLLNTAEPRDRDDRRAPLIRLAAIAREIAGGSP